MLCEEKTAQVLRKLAQIRARESDAFASARLIAREILGARKYDESDAVQFGFWIPGLTVDRVTQLKLELFTPPSDFDLSAMQKGETREAVFQYESIPLSASGEILAGVHHHRPLIL